MMNKFEFLNNLMENVASGKIDTATAKFFIEIAEKDIDTTTTNNNVVVETPPPTTQNAPVTPVAPVKEYATTCTITLYQTKKYSQNVLVFDKGVDSETSKKLHENFKFASNRNYWYPKYSENDFANFGRKDHKEYYNKAMNDFVNWFNSRK